MNRSQKAIEVFNKHAKAYQDKFMDVSLYTKSFDTFCDAIVKKNPEILEVACGPGNITNYLLNKRNDFKILGTDLAPNMIELAKINNPIAKFQLMDARGILELNKKYDGIMCGFCLPYFTKAEALKFITDSNVILNPNGLLYISTMEDSYEKSAIQKGSQGDEIFIHYHQEDYLAEALVKNNFNILKTERVNSVLGNGIKVVDLIIIAKKTA